MQGREAAIGRKTKETEIELTLSLDGSGKVDVQSTVGFFDHMLTAWATHALFDLKLRATGDVHIDHHHVVEDVGICLGRALDEALGNKSGISRFGDAVVPLDEALVLCAVDLSGRGYLGFEMKLGRGKVGEFDVELVEEFFRAMAINGKINLHLHQFSGRNKHHVIEATFKSCAVALSHAVTTHPRRNAIPSTKGTLTE